MSVRSKPSILKMSERKKQEAIDAVLEALEILNRKMSESRECWSESWKGNTHTITMINHSHKFLSVYVSLIVGCSQQKHLKQNIRRSEVWLESWKIAKETGANFEEVEDLFLLYMSHYVEPKR
jgi:hypothetical protein